VRRSVLAPEPAFATALAEAASALAELDGLRIDDRVLPDGTIRRIWALISGLGVVENKATIVAGTKTLHHLLPDLVPPMDPDWTGLFFGYQPQRFQGDQQALFSHMYATFREIATQVDLPSRVNGLRWRTSMTKLLDNAAIGYCLAELPTRSIEAQPGVAGATVAAPDPATSALIEGGLLSFRVDRHFPPAKNTATSMLSASHPDAARVRALLATAQAAVAAHPRFTPISEGRVGLDVVLTPLAGREAWVATNYLGGIAHVLEDQGRRGAAVEHLGDLVNMWLYRTDRQIKQVTYREEPDDPAGHGYRVTVRRLPN
jgi:hypothetical protein